MRNDLGDEAGVSGYLEVEAPASVDAGLPAIPRFVVLLSVQGWMEEVLLKEFDPLKIEGLPAVRSSVKLHQGWFDQSIPVWRQAYTGPLAFVHMDTGLYNSTKTIFELLGDRFVAGTVIQFDELIHYPGWSQGEWKALSEFRKQRNAEVTFLGYVNHGEQVALKILKMEPPSGQ